MASCWHCKRGESSRNPVAPKTLPSGLVRELCRECGKDYWFTRAADERARREDDSKGA